MGICKLCLNEKELIRRSHLFPNFMYKGIGDDNNRMYLLSSSSPFHKKVVQTGAYEEYILCADCDNNILSKLERYANNTLYSQPYRTNTDNFEQVKNTNNVCVIHCTNVDYSIFKLFLQSLIWRASISSHDLFNYFKLTPQQEEQLRFSILNSTPLNKDDYACMILTHQNDEEANTDLVFINSEKPQKISFFINQFIYLFHLDKSVVDEELLSLTLTEENKMGITKLPDGEWGKIRASVINGVSTLAKRNIV